MLKAMDGAYELARPGRRVDRGDLPARRRPLHPDDRDAQAQGREGHHRHRAEGPQEARRVALTPACPGPVRDPPLHRQGRGRQDHRAAGTAALRRRRGPPHAGAVHRRRALARRRLRRAGRRRADRGRRPACSCSRSTRSGASSSPGPRSRATCSPCSTPPGSTRSPPRSSRSSRAPRRCSRCSSCASTRAPGDWDVVVVDCAPTAETLRLLALPEALGWYMDRVFPVERRIVKALRPVLARAAGVPMPHDSVFDAVERLHRDLEEVRDDALRARTPACGWCSPPRPSSSPRPAGRCTTLSLFGYRVDGVVANRVFPAEGADAWRGRLGAGPGRGAARGGAVVRRAAGLALGLPAGEPVGVDALRGFAERGVRRRRPARRCPPGTGR